MAESAAEGGEGDGGEEELAGGGGAGRLRSKSSRAPERGEIGVRGIPKKRGGWGKGGPAACRKGVGKPLTGPEICTPKIAAR